MVWLALVLKVAFSKREALTMMISYPATMIDATNWYDPREFMGLLGAAVDSSHPKVFARATPNQKESIVDAYRQKPGSFVTYVGDGMSDFLGMKKANCGILFGSAVMGDVMEKLRVAADVVVVKTTEARGDLMELVDAIERGYSPRSAGCSCRLL